MSDLTFTDSILKAVILQAGVNTNGPVKSQYKNTFIFRLGRLLHNQKKTKLVSAHNPGRIIRLKNTVWPKSDQYFISPINDWEYFIEYYLIVFFYEIEVSAERASRLWRRANKVSSNENILIMKKSSFSYRFSVNTELKHFDHLADKEYIATHGKYI